VVLEFDPPVGTSYDLSSSTFYFAIGVSVELPTIVVTSTLTSQGGITVSGSTILVTLDQTATALLQLGANSWTLYEIITAKQRVIANGKVEVQLPAGVPV
jgi:hypothetical protein